MGPKLDDPSFLENPGDSLATLRQAGPLTKVKVPLIGEVWMTTTDEATRSVLKSGDVFVRDPGARGGRPLTKRYWWMPPFMRPLLSNMLAFDGEDHKRLRGLVEMAFNRSQVDDMRPRLNHIAQDLLSEIDSADVVDIRRAYSQQLPLRTICELLGIPEADRDRITRWIAPISGATNAWTFIAALPGFWRLLRYFKSGFETARRDPHPGLISELVAAEHDGDRLSEDELLGMVVTLFIAGHETTVHLINNGIVAGLRDQSLRASILEHPDKLPLMVEEFMRFYSPVMLTKPLYAVEDTDILGAPVKEGEAVMAGLIAANHDDARHDDAKTFRLDRRPNAHLGFGHGPHVCLGMQLARAEAQVAIRRFFETFPKADLIEPVSWSKRTGIRGPARVMVRPGPRSRVPA